MRYLDPIWIKMLHVSALEGRMYNVENSAIQHDGGDFHTMQDGEIIVVKRGDVICFNEDGKIVDIVAQKPLA